ncbi:thioredoxin reductase 1, mitochondrial-like [Diaphorina citri]|uniref:Thioredoxin reductase 1, mitochondrial-like n=1 Tax=Diaphorina citri TaxID=121845 RepID=A0A3Q0JAU0_DIACI|nr:thioredoxin reductase 1, mitochondrial-like [Diaphorina citri]
MFSGLDFLSKSQTSGLNAIHAIPSFHEAKTCSPTASSCDLLPSFETPPAYISRLSYENRILIFTHAVLREENARAERYLNARGDRFAVLYLDRIGDEGILLEEELKRQTNQILRRYISSIIISRSDLELEQDSTSALNVTIRNWNAATKLIKRFCIRAKNDSMRELKALGIDIVRTAAAFTNPHTIKLSNRSVTGFNFLLAVERRCLPEPRNSALISADDLFRLGAWPGKTLVLGGSLMAVEIAATLNFLGVPVTLVYSRRLLKHFDQEMVRILLSSLTKAGVSIQCCVIEKVISSFDGMKGVRGFHPESKEPFADVFKTVVNAMEKKFDFAALNLHHIGVDIKKKSYVVCNEKDQTSVGNIFAVGGIVHGKPNNASMAAISARLIIERLYGMQDQLMDYSFLPVVVRGDVEFGTVGMSEEAAAKVYGADGLVIYKSSYPTFDNLLDPLLPENFVKLVCLKGGERVLGIHVIGQNVAGMIFGYSLALRKFLTKAELDGTMCVDMSNMSMITRLNLH